MVATCVFRQGAATNKLPAPISLYGLFLAHQIDRIKNPYTYQYALNAQHLIKPKESPYVHIILVVDESVRFDYSPFLRLDTFGDWNVFDYGRATSYANSSAPSNIMLRKGVRFESVTADFYQNALIWDYARIAHYQTHLYDAQGGGRGHDYFDSNEIAMIDVNERHSGVESDAEIFQSLKYLQGRQKTFTLIIKKGAHFPYDAYPKEYKIQREMNDYQRKTNQRVRYFKNVLYQSDRFWQEFFKLNIKEPTLVIYTSDHGQNLEDVNGLTHGSTENPYIGEGLVPLVVLSNIPNEAIKLSLNDNLNQASHFNIFPTLLEAMGYSPRELGYVSKSSSLYEKIEKVNGFFYGIPFGYFGRKPDFKAID